MSNDRQEFMETSIDYTYIDNALKALRRSLEQPKDEFIRDSCIQRFEFSTELLWKTMKKVLVKKGLEAASPRDVFRAAAQLRFIEDPKVWFFYLELRNNSSHTYKEELAEKIYKELPQFLSMSEALVEKLKNAQI